MHFCNLVGQQFGRLKVLERVDAQNKKAVYWRCLCKCGNETVVRSDHLRYGKVKSCGCLTSELASTLARSNILDIRGVRFGSLVADEYVGTRGTNGAYWRCNCDCGNTHVVSTTALRTGQSTHCDKCAIVLTGSAGEKQVALMLEELGYSFIHDWKDHDCRFETGYPAKFDFWVNNRYVIEIDGAQHFIPRNFYGGEFGLEYIQSHDAIKTSWCLEHNIPLLRIPYPYLGSLEASDLQPETSRFLILT